MDSYIRLKTQLNKYVKKFPLPTKAINLDRFKLLAELRETLPTNQQEYDDLREMLIISNGGFAMKYAITYCKKINNSEMIDDLFQQAQIGIIEAVDRFDTTRNVNFTTFAYFYVRKCIIDYIKRSKVVSVNRNMARYIKHIQEIHDELYKDYEGFEPDTMDIKNKLFKDRDIDIKESVVVQLLTLIELNSTSDQSFTTDNFDSVKDEEKSDMLLQFQNNILNALKHIGPKYLELVKMRFGIGYDRPYSIEELKYIKDLSKEEIKYFIELTELYLL